MANPHASATSSKRELPLFIYFRSLTADATLLRHFVTLYRRLRREHVQGLVCAAALLMVHYLCCIGRIDQERKKKIPFWAETLIIMRVGPERWGSCGIYYFSCSRFISRFLCRQSYYFNDRKKAQLRHPPLKQCL